MRTLVLGVVLVWLTAGVFAGEAPANLRCEWRLNPREARDPCPELTWEAPSQEAFRVVVATTAAALARPAASVWDSGKVESRLPIVEYAGPRSRCHQPGGS